MLSGVLSRPPDASRCQLRTGPNQGEHAHAWQRQLVRAAKPASLSTPVRGFGVYPRHASMAWHVSFLIEGLAKGHRDGRARRASRHGKRNPTTKSKKNRTLQNRKRRKTLESQPQRSDGGQGRTNTGLVSEVQMSVQALSRTVGHQVYLGNRNC